MELTTRYQVLSSAVRQVFYDRLRSHQDFVALNTVSHIGPLLASSAASAPIDFRVGSRTIHPFEVASLLALARRITEGEQGEALQLAMAEHFGLPPVLAPAMSADLL